MNKSEAMKRLDAIEAEAKALRELISKPDKIEYEFGKLYCAIRKGIRYLMVYSGETYLIFGFAEKGDGHCMLEIDGALYEYNGYKDSKPLNDSKKTYG